MIFLMKIILPSQGNNVTAKAKTNKS